MNDTDIREWLQQHRATVVDTTLAAVYENPSVMWGYYDPTADISQATLKTRTERVYTIRVAEHDLAKMCQFERQVFGNIRHYEGHFEYFQKMMDTLEHERRLRNENPGVREAYEHYKLMMALNEGK